MLMELFHIFIILIVINNVLLMSVFKIRDLMLHISARIVILIAKHANSLLINALLAKII